ncbi:S24 family peptidase [Vibrio rhizosphaerae]|uniref:S24 family peptidase n=1 Tax=Vibrio rhizosphaerae TaxID=398736 RepID=A0ABU4IXA2_9VIBR|nr:S24 family peptidase [Vibrio rhizosphaerae]MDW6094027.1 S24 family peptidase [Vibrio rhizosphaerae]
METIGERLKQARVAKDMTQDSLVAALKKADPTLTVTRMNISHLENNMISSMKERLFLAVTQVLSCDPSWLVYGTGQMIANPLQENRGNVAQIDHSALLCPIISWDKANAFSQASTPYSPDKYEYMACPIPTGEGTYILKIQEDAMAPKFVKDDLIFVDPTQTEGKHGTYVIVTRTDSNETTLKQLQILDGKKYLRAFNYPSELEFVPMTGNNNIIGTVVTHLKPL